MVRLLLLTAGSTGSLDEYNRDFLSAPAPTADMVLYDRMRYMTGASHLEGMRMWGFEGSRGLFDMKQEPYLELRNPSPPTDLLVRLNSSLRVFNSDSIRCFSLIADIAAARSVSTTCIVK